MSIQDWGAIGEIVGAIGVILTLVYLATQIRQNTRSMSENNLHTQTDRSIGHSRFVAGTPEMMSIYQRGMDDPTQLTKEEYWRFGTFLFSMFLDFQESYHLRGRDEDFYWRISNQNYLFYLSKPGGRQWWDGQGRHMLDEEFVQYIDGQLTE